MHELTDLAGESLEWSRDSGWMHPSYVLRHGQQTVGALHFEKGWRSPGRLEAGGREYHLERSGAFTSRAIVVTDELGEKEATFRQGFFRIGTLTLDDGSVIETSGPGLFSRTLSLVDSGGSELARIRSVGFTGQRAECVLTPSGASHPSAGLLLGIAWYVMILRRRQAAAAS